MNDLADRTGIDKGNLSKLEANKIGYSRDAIDRIAKVLGVSVGVLFSDPGVVEAAALHMRQAPLLNASELATWKGPDDFEEHDGQQFLYVALERASRHVFAIRVADNANAPFIQEADELVFDANGKLALGMFVAAQAPDDSVCIGRFRQLSAASADGTHFEVLAMADLDRSVSSREVRGLRIRGVLVELRRHSLRS